MHTALLEPNLQEFIDAHLGSDIVALALQKNPFPEVEWSLILNQILAKSKAKDKLPTWFSTRQIIYPAKLSIEQSSSEITAHYKASLVSGNSLIDLTGGFGVDDYYFAKHFQKVVHCEINAQLSEVVCHNFKQLRIGNMDCIIGDSSEILKQLDTKFDWIYIDPSRRNDVKGKVFLLKDCLPNVSELLHFYFDYSNRIMIKTAPILDITAGLTELRHVKNIHIVAVENEVKELLWEIEKDYSGPVAINTVNLLKTQQERFGFILSDSGACELGLPKKYLYEPNSAIMKSGGFDQIGNSFALEKLHAFSHLYTSDALTDFPGRIFEIGHQIGYQKADMKLHLENRKANVTARNFPDSVEVIRKKWKIKDGGDQYCFFTTDRNNNKIVLICTKIK